MNNLLFFIGLIAPLLWALIVHLDKFLIEKYIKEDDSGVGSLVMYSSLIGLLVAPILFVVDALFIGNGIFSLNGSEILLILISGFIVGMSYTLYLHALFEDEASIVSPLFQLIPVFGFFLGYFFLGEIISPVNTVGIFIVVLGSLILAYNIEFKKEKVEGSVLNQFKVKILILMTLSSFLFALSGALFKKGAGGFIVSNFWYVVGLALFGIILFVFVKVYREDFVSSFKNHGKAIMGINMLNETLNISGEIILNLLLISIPIAIALSVESFQPLFVLILGIVFTKYLKDFPKEDLSRRHLVHKILSIILLVIGGILINL